MMSIFNRIPSVLENLIYNEYVNYCPVCNIYEDKHTLVECSYCDKDLCLNKGGVWKTKGEFICVDCRLKLIKTKKSSNFQFS